MDGTNAPDRRMVSPAGDERRQRVREYSAGWGWASDGSRPVCRPGREDAGCDAEEAFDEQSRPDEGQDERESGGSEEDDR